MIMRILFVTYPEKPIFQPMVPLAWALRAAGHEVRVASQPFFTSHIVGAGLTAVPVGRQRSDNWRRLTEAFPERAAAERAGLPAPYDAAVSRQAHATPAEWTRLQAGYRHVLDGWHKQNNAPLVNDLVDFALAWRPHLIVWEATTYAGAIAAKASGAAHARMLWSVDVFGRTRDAFRELAALESSLDATDPLAEWLDAYGRKYGFQFSEDMVTGQLTLDHLPASLRLDAATDYLPSRFVPFGGTSVVPSWLREPPSRPRVALTLGTTATEWFAGYTFSAREALEALCELDVDVVATTQHSSTQFARALKNLRLVDYVPLDQLAPTCDVVINHAGPSTLLTTALHGVPQLHLPWEFDEPILARRAAEHGSALTLPPEQASGRSISELVRRLLDEAHFTDRAHALREEIRAMPPPAAVVRTLVDVATERREFSL